MRNEGFSVQPDVGRSLPDSTRNFYRIFKQSQPDVVHLHNPTPTIYAAMAARLAGAPSILSTRHSLIAPPRKVVEELKYAFAARFCDWIVGICNATTDNLKSIHSVPMRKIVRIYNGVAPLPRVAKNDCPPRKGSTLLSVSRLEPVKNHRLLLTSFRVALSSMPDLNLWIVGDGSERKNLEALAAELGIAGQVTFWGQQLDVAPFFSAADSFIMSSKSEGLPISLLEAFSVGLPSIVTDVGGMAEALRLAQGGIAVSGTDPAQMAAAILRLATGDSEREQFSKNAEAKFRSCFSLRTMTDTYMDLYQNTPRVRRALKK